VNDAFKRTGNIRLKPITRRCVHAIVLAAAVGGSVAGFADTNYYRWIDNRGNPVHSDRPPPKGIDYEVVSTQSSFTRAVSAEEGAVPAEVEPRVGNEFTPEDSSAADRSKKNSELCQRARSNLETLTASDTVNIRNNEGEVQQLNPQELQVQRATAKAQVEVYCE
jgi:hypothetical protein